MIKILKLNTKILFGLSILTLAFYLYLITSITVNIIERKNTEFEIKQVNGKISDLELNYLSLDRQINVKFAQSLGFTENNQTFFATPPAFVFKQ